MMTMRLKTMSNPAISRSFDFWHFKSDHKLFLSTPWPGALSEIKAKSLPAVGQTVQLKISHSFPYDKQAQPLFTQTDMIKVTVAECGPPPMSTLKGYVKIKVLIPLETTKFAYGAIPEGTFRKFSVCTIYYKEGDEQYFIPIPPA